MNVRIAPAPSADSTMVKSQPETSVVYHYTSLSTLMKIVETRQLWATSIKYLNDTREREGFLDAAYTLLPTLAQDPTLDSTAFEPYLRGDRDKVQQSTELPSVVSFSRLPDSLPQWRSYCNAGDGVSIGFDVESLKKARINGNKILLSNGVPHELNFPVYFREVTYIQKGDFARVEDAVRSIYRKAVNDEGRFGSAEDGVPDIPLEQWFRVFLEDEAATYKDDDFEAEQESRLLASNVLFRPSLLHFRTSGTALVPYLKLDIPNPDGSEDLLKPWQAIKRVCVGPNANLDLTAEAVWNLFRSLSMDVAVEKTEVSFRSW